MITGPRSFFEARCRERGYTLGEVRGCVVREDGDAITVDETHADYPRHPNAGHSLTFLQKAKNFATSAARHLAAGMPMCTQEQIDARYAICQQCEHFQAGACAKCGCPLVRERQYISKLSWAHEECPAGKWGPTG